MVSNRGGMYLCQQVVDVEGVSAQVHPQPVDEHPVHRQRLRQTRLPHLSIS